MAISMPSRVAGPDEAISVDELRLAGRNHAMPLEALRYDITPIGLHYLLVHYDIPLIEPATWRLTIDGTVERRRTLTLDDLRARPRVSRTVTLECAGNGRARLDPRPVSQPWLDEAVGTATWTGTRLAPLLQEAGLRPGVMDVVFTGSDHGIERGIEQDYARGLALSECLRPDALLAYEMNGQPLAPQHGFPLRLIVPGWYGMAQVKWLRSITVLDTPYDGFQNAVAYRYQTADGEPGEPVTRIRPRALVVPPGFPDFMSRARVVDAGQCKLHGRAWSGTAPITRVDVSVDGGASWAAADLEPALDEWAWRAWTYDWLATPGMHELVVRAHDAAGNVQPVDQPWNRQGMGNNMAQRLPVVVREPDSRG